MSNVRRIGVIQEQLRWVTVDKAQQPGGNDWRLMQPRMFQSRTLRTVLVLPPLVAVGLFIWLRTDALAPAHSLFDGLPSQRSESRSRALIELAELGQAAEKVRLRRRDGGAIGVLDATRDDVRASAADFLSEDVVKLSPLRVAAAIAILRDTSSGSADASVSWRPLMVVGKILTLRAEALMVNEGADAAWKQAQQALAYVESLYGSARSIDQLAIARTIQTFASEMMRAAVAAREWPSVLLAEIAGVGRSMDLAPHLLRAIEHEYTTAMARIESEARSAPALLRPIFYQPNRTEALWLNTFRAVIPALGEGNATLAYRLATQRPRVKEQVPILWRNWLGYKHSVPSIDVCVDSILLIATASLQMQLVGLAANLGRFHAERGAFPESLDALANAFPGADIQDPWAERAAPLRYSVRDGIVYSVGPNKADDRAQLKRSFEISHATDDYGVVFER